MRYTAVFNVDTHEGDIRNVRKSYSEDNDFGAMRHALAHMLNLGKNYMCPFFPETTDITLSSLSDQNGRELPQEKLFTTMTFEPPEGFPIKHKYAGIQDGKVVASFSGIESILLREFAEDLL